MKKMKNKPHRSSPKFPFLDFLHSSSSLPTHYRTEKATTVVKKGMICSLQN